MFDIKTQRPVLLASVWMAFVLLLPASSQAAQIQSITVEKSANGDVVSIQTDEIMDYQVYDLSAPARLVLNFPGAGIEQAVSPLKYDQGGVTSVFPVASADGVRLEIGMDRSLTYQIEQQPDGLQIRFAAVPAGLAGAPRTAAAELIELEVRDQGGVTELVVRGRQMDANHNAFVTNQGKTMILDFWGGVSRLPKEFYSFASQRIRSINVGQAEGRARLVVNLQPGATAPHQIDAGSGQLVVRFGSSGAERKAGLLKVEDVAFKPDGRTSHLVIRMDATDAVVDLHEQGGNVVLDIIRARLAPGQERSLDVSDFPGAVSQVDAYNAGDKVRIVARLREKASYSSFQRGNVLTITLEPDAVTLAKAAAGAEKEALLYTGEPVTFDFKDIDIRNALKMIAEMSGMNIIMADDVTGTLTMRLMDVPWDQALELILAARGLGKEQMGNVVRIVPLDVLRTEQQARLEVQKGIAELAPLVSEYITLNFATATDVVEMLQGSQSTPAAGTSATTTTSTGSTGAGTENTTTLLSDRGSIQADVRTNTLIVVDTQNSVNNIKRLVEVLDKPVQQVLIEARIVEATDNFTRDLGIRWGGQFNEPSFSDGFPSSVNVGSASGVAGTATEGFIVDLPAAIATESPGAAIGVALGTLSGAVNLDLELSAAESDNDVKIVSSPRLITANMQEAYIKSGEKVSIVTPATTTEPATTELVDAVLELRVTPQITADKDIILDILITKDKAATVLGLVGISTNEIKTNILLNNGETVVIGGIYTREDNVTEQGVPFLMDIPLLGWLFKTKLTVDNRTELLIFLTPKIIEQAPGKIAGSASSS